MTVERTVKVATIVATIDEALSFIVTQMDAERLTVPLIAAARATGEVEG